jgi:hypothetical protein
VTKTDVQLAGINDVFTKSSAATHEHDHGQLVAGRELMRKIRLHNNTDQAVRLNVEAWRNVLSGYGITVTVY